MSSTWGNQIKISVFGESHGAGIGVVLDGLPAGARIDLDAVLLQMARRAPGNDPAAGRQIPRKFFPDCSTAIPPAHRLPH